MVEKSMLKVLKPRRYPKISIMIFRDASLEGWGACMDNVSTGGALFSDDRLMHINVLELNAVLLVLKPLVKTSQKHIKIMSDNSTILYITKM